MIIPKPKFNFGQRVKYKCDEEEDVWGFITGIYYRRNHGCLYYTMIDDDNWEMSDMLEENLEGE